MTTPQSVAEHFGEAVKMALGQALLTEQKAENAFGIGGKQPNRRAIFQNTKAAWRKYDDALEELIQYAHRLSMDQVQS